MKRTITALLLMTLLLLPLLTACGAESKMEADKENALADDAYGVTETAEGTLAENSDAAVGRKLVTTVQISLESTAYDKDTKNIKAQAAQYGGYTEEESASGNADTHSRYASYTMRIPSDRLEAFLNAIEGIGNSISFSRNTSDITLSYVDTESRIKALETERDSLMRVLEKAETVDQIISVQSALSDVTYELENAASQKRVMDNQVDYASVSVAVNEVERATTPEKRGTWAQIAANLGDNLYALGRGFTAFFVWFVSALPFFTVIAVPGVIVLLILRRRKRKKTKQRMSAADNTAQK